MRSTFRTLFYLKKNQPKKNGNVVIMIRVTVDGDQVQFSTKLEIHPDLWDVQKGRAKGNTVKAAQLNRLLDNIRGQISMHYTKLMNENGYVLPERIKNAFLGIEEKEKTLINYFTLHNEQYKLKVGTTATHKTYTRYELTKQRLIEFMQERFGYNDIPIKELNTVFIEDFYLYIRNTTTCNNNSTMKFIQRMRTVLNYAKNTGLNFIDPFANYRFNFERVDRDYLEHDEINAIYNKEFASSRLNQVRDMFIFACYTGLSYIDLCELTEENIRVAFDNHLWIMTKRHKTDVASNIRLLDVPKAILEKYRGKLKDGNILPIISNQKMNDYLKEIATVCNIDKKISFHVARHSFATLALTQGTLYRSDKGLS